MSDKLREMSVKFFTNVSGAKYASHCPSVLANETVSTFQQEHSENKIIYSLKPEWGPYERLNTILRRRAIQRLFCPVVIRNYGMIMNK